MRLITTNDISGRSHPRLLDSTPLGSAAMSRSARFRGFHPRLLDSTPLGSGAMSRYLLDSVGFTHGYWIRPRWESEGFRPLRSVPARPLIEVFSKSASHHPEWSSTHYRPADRPGPCH